jgi:hypothetical protein
MFLIYYKRTFSPQYFLLCVFFSQREKNNFFITFTAFFKNPAKFKATWFYNICLALTLWTGGTACLFRTVPVALTGASLL